MNVNYVLDWKIVAKMQTNWYYINTKKSCNIPYHLKDTLK